MEYHPKSEPNAHNCAGNQIRTVIVDLPMAIRELFPERFAADGTRKIISPKLRWP
jgi:hypothetical protein